MTEEPINPVGGFGFRWTRHSLLKSDLSADPLVTFRVNPELRD